MPQFDDQFSKDRIAELRRQEEERLIQALAPQYGYEYINLHGVNINPEALITLSEKQAREAELVVFEKTFNSYSVAFRNPNKQEAQAILANLSQKQPNLQLFMCSTDSLEHAWNRYNDVKNTSVSNKGVLDVSTEELQKTIEAISTLEDIQSEILSIRKSDAADRVSRTVVVIFAGALALKTSDIHIEPSEEDIRLRYRLDGVLQDVIDLEHSIYQKLMARLKLLAGMKLNIHNEAQDGRFTFQINEREVEVRASVIPDSSGESMVMRLLDPGSASFNMDRLGLSDRIEAVIREQLARPNGLIITTGPTGSGKTTALYAFLQSVHKPEIKIITIEDPVEYKLDGIVQTQASGDYTFASGLRAVLRQDPDVIMVGEIRDREVAETAVHAAQTGHLVFSTLHTNSAAGAFPRLIDLGVDRHMLGSALNLILAQRLVRNLCNNCKQSYEASQAETALVTHILAEHPEQPTVPNPLQLYKPVGCDACNNTGYVGRSAIFEGIVVDEAVEDAVIRDPRDHIILEAAKPQRIATMPQYGMVKVVNGITDLTELKRVVDLGGSTNTKDDTDEPVPDISEHIVT